ncbi:MAG: ABC transporter ATP-binding protein [Candidatus Gygaella obscura]|nr:ABC transporter ATP-binding protein [Candidatus Gygaella obscura]
MNKNMIKAIDIHKNYFDAGKKLQVLRGVSLEVKQNEILCVIGPSGAGKSTLLHILGGLDKPSKGYVQIQGRDLSGLNEDELSLVRNEKIGFVFQFYHLLSEFNILENVALPAFLSKKQKQGSRDKIYQRSKQLLKLVGLDRRMDHMPTELSGGEMQRVAIARALMNEPEVLLCDEPTGNLDSENGINICNILKQLNNKSKTTIVLVSHDENMKKIATRTVFIKDGLLVDTRK